MKKIILAVICLVTVITATILPTFAWTQSGDTAQHTDAVFTLNGSGQYFYDAYYTNYGEYYFNTFGDILLFTAPRLSVGSGNIQFPYQGEEASYYVYLNCDDNSGQWLFKIFDYVHGTWYTYNATEKNIYAYYVNDYVPIIYNQNIENIMSNYRNAVSGKEFMLWSAFKTADATMIVIPTRYNNTIGYNGGFEKGYTQGHGDGYEAGYGAGKDAGVSEGINTKTTFLDGLQMIFTAPGYFINSIFDFELFGFNMANVIRAILTLALVGVVVVLFVKFL